MKATKPLIMFRGASVLFASAMVLGCADSRNEEPDAWVSVPVSPNGGPTFPSEGGILPDLAARSVKPKEIICGVVRANYNPDLIYGPPPPSRIYHFLVSFEEATQLVATGKYIFRDSYDANLPFTAIGCNYFGLITSRS